jgi:hypothetical protein
MGDTLLVALPHYEEWRLSFVLPAGDVKTGALLERLRERLPAEVDAHRKGRRGIRLYAQSRESIGEAETIVADVLSSHGLRCALEVTRWNPADEKWQSPLLPVEPPRGPLPDAWSDLDEAAWEIRLRFPHGWEAAQLHAKLLARDAAVICNGKRLTIGVADERTARQRAAELRLAAPTATMEVRPLSRWRVWLLRQKLLGNYAGGDGSTGDSGGWGGNGGGNGG